MAPISSGSCCLVIVICSVFAYYYPVLFIVIVSDVKEKSTGTEKMISSVWCRGQNRSTRTCRFQNLCYLPAVNQFVFYYDSSSEIVGLESEKHFFRNIVDMSSIENHNSLTLSFTVIPSNKSEIKIVNKPVFLIRRFKPDNLMHVIHDDLFPLYHTYGNICFGNIHKCKETFSLLFVDGQGSYFPQLYELFGSAIINLPVNDPVCFNEIYAGLSKETVWYQYGFHGVQGPTQNHLTGMVVRRFGDFLLENLKGNAAECPQNGTVLLSRKRTRRILNEDQLLQSMSKNNVTILSLEEDDLLRIFRCVRDAHLLVGMHGALLISSLFLQPNSRLLELFPRGIDSSQITPYKTLVTLPLMGVHYEAWEDNRGVDNYVNPGRCCDDPTWIRFINQDTRVDAKEIEIIIKNMEKKSHNYTNKWEEALLYPSPPSHVECRWIPGNLLIQWNQPWNILLMGHHVHEVHYDVVLASGSFQQQYLTKELNINITIEEEMPSVRVWIKCVVNDMYHSTDTVLLCSKSE